MMRVLAVLAALFVGLIGLAMSLCGGGFLLAALSPFNPALLLLTLGSLAVGILLLWGASSLLKKGTTPPGTDREPD